MTGGIHHFAIKVRDLPAAERFYRNVLGLVVLRRWPAAAGKGDRSIWLAVGGQDETFLALESVGDEGGQEDSQPNQRESHEDSQREDRQSSLAVLATAAAPGRAAGGHHLLALRIQHGERTVWEARLTAAGVTITHRTDFTIYFSDPEGNRLGLSHYPASAAEHP